MTIPQSARETIIVTDPAVGGNEGGGHTQNQELRRGEAPQFGAGCKGELSQQNRTKSCSVSLEQGAREADLGLVFQNGNKELKRLIANRKAPVEEP